MAEKHKVVVYALSTCIWCKKTLEFLKKSEVECKHIFVDELEANERTKTYDEMKKHNKTGNFPTVVIDDEKVVVGYNEQELSEVLGL